MPWTYGLSDDPAKRGNQQAVERYRLKHPERVRTVQRRLYEKNLAQIKQYDSERHRKKREAKWAKAAHPRPAACEICGTKGQEFPSRKSLVFDHCHTSGEFRGWLCGRCNRVLGSCKDDAALLRKLADYLDAMDSTTETLST